jgi:hypothetical protein
VIYPDLWSPQIHDTDKLWKVFLIRRVLFLSKKEFTKEQAFLFIKNK